MWHKKRTSTTRLPLPKRRRSRRQAKKIDQLLELDAQRQAGRLARAEHAVRPHEDLIPFKVQLFDSQPTLPTSPPATRPARPLRRPVQRRYIS